LNNEQRHGNSFKSVGQRQKSCLVGLGKDQGSSQRSYWLDGRKGRDVCRHSQKRLAEGEALY
ncbi:MAG: hypothetical protein M3O11_00940, partial [Pseudomonadota bacterium]|nr:hypothetical protein [Pseudomonadota bacterium]